jgi:hypothetical protein
LRKSSALRTELAALAHRALPGPSRILAEARKEEQKVKRLTMMIAAGLLLVAAATLLTSEALAQQKAVTSENLNQMIAKAKTPADHEAVASYYDKQAADYVAKAKLHLSVAKTYEKFRMKPPDMANHCRELARYFQRIADQYKALATEHRAMARKAGGRS